jgi:beta-glucosidase
VAEGTDLDIAVTVTNTGRRPGKEVVQVYLAEPGRRGDHARPVRALAAFTVVRAAPGQRATARVTIPARAFARYDKDLASWIWPGGMDSLPVDAIINGRTVRVNAGII